jgi:site-specific recombinase XerD
MAVKPKTDPAGESIPGVWIIDYRPQGRKGPRLRREFGSVDHPHTKAEALALEMELRRLSRREPVSMINPKVYDLLGDWKQEYANDHEASTCKDLNCSLVRLVPFFGPLYLAEITPSLIEQYKGQRLATRVEPKRRKGESDTAYALRHTEQTRTISKRTINKELSYLSGFFKWAAEHRYCDPIRVKLFPVKQTTAARARPLHPDEVNTLLEHLEPQYRLTFLLYNDGGLRRAEVLGGGKYLGIRAQDVDLGFGLLYVRGKGDKERIVPITTRRLRQSLEDALQTNRTGHLCINPHTGKPWYSIRKALLRAAEKAGIDKRVYHHLLRHNFGTHAVASGMNLRTVQEIMGHSTIKTTEIYTHMAPFLQTESEKFSAFVEPKSTRDNPTPRKPATPPAPKKQTKN